MRNKRNRSSSIPDEVKREVIAIVERFNRKYSRRRFFPGIDEIDGTIEGAMRAGLEAYPV